MQLNFLNFDKLASYFDFVSKKLKRKDIFFVWWVIRDILLWRKIDNFDDVDITLSGDPEMVYKKINKKNIHIFRTEKFGTITLLPTDKTCKYEITPFRCEWKYEDFRHPSEIEWTNDLIEDSNRRDFTVNCLYYSIFDVKIVEKQKYKFNIKNKEYILNKFDDKKIINTLKNHWIVYLQKNNVLILQSHKIINKFIKNWKIIVKEIFKILPTSFWEKKIHILIDPHEWLNNFVIQKLKTVWNPDDRFKEDALRIIRAIRFVNTLNQDPWIKYDFDTETWRSCKKNYYLVKFLPKERINQELIKMFEKDNPFGVVSLFDELNILKYIFPSLHATKNIDQPVRYHPFDVYAHTILSLFHLQQINKNYLVKLWMVFHDVGKPDQYYFHTLWLSDVERKELFKWYIYHSVQWVDIAKIDLQVLWFSNKEIDEITFYIRYHLVPWELLNMTEKNQTKKIRKLISEHWKERLLNLCDINTADRLGQYNPIQNAETKDLFDLKTKVNNVFKDSGKLTLKNIPVNGNDIINKFNITPWKMLWEILNFALDYVLEDPYNNKDKKKILAHIKKTFKLK